MKIAMFSDCYLDLTGGIVSSMNAQKTALEKKGHEVYIFSSGFPRSQKEQEELARKKIFMVPSCRLWFRGLTPVSRRPRIIEKWLLKNFPELADFDIFYIHYEAGCSIAGLHLAKKLGIPAVQMMHGREDMGEGNLMPYGLRTAVAYLLNWIHAWYLPHPLKISRDEYLADTLAKAKMWELMVNHANAADLVLSPSEHFRKKLKAYGVKKPIEVIANGYADEKFLPKVTVRELKKGQPLRIIWHSRVSAEKRMMPFLEALKIVKKKSGARILVDVYGGGGDYFRAKRFARKHKLNVRFYGTVKFAEIQKGINKAHLDVLVSYNFDTFGMTLIEAEAAGVGVFFCDPDMREVVPTGSFVMAKSPEAEKMAEALLDLIAHPERVREMSEAMIRHREEILISNRIELLIKAFSGIIKK
jgi:1,2-diacylglycerol 3-alpha-glucosyltransferase